MDINFNVTTVLFFLGVFLFISDILLIGCVIFVKPTKKRYVFKLFIISSAAYAIVVILFLSVCPEVTVLILPKSSFDISKLTIGITAIITLIFSLIGVHLLKKE